MRDESPPPAGDAGGAPTPVALAATQEPIRLSVRLVEDERVPEGMVCMGTYRNERLVARTVLDPEAWSEIEELGLFAEPLAVVLVAREAPPGLQCQLFAMAVLPPGAGEDEEEEPWAASVPTFESAGDGADTAANGDAERDPRVVPIPLGNIVRYARDRVHPESLPLEAMDVLRKVVEGSTSEVVDRALADLLGL